MECAEWDLPVSSSGISSLYEQMCFVGDDYYSPLSRFIAAPLQKHGAINMKCIL